MAKLSVIKWQWDLMSLEMERKQNCKPSKISHLWEPICYHQSHMVALFSFPLYFFIYIFGFFLGFFTHSRKHFQHWGNAWTQCYFFIAAFFDLLYFVKLRVETLTISTSSFYCITLVVPYDPGKIILGQVFRCCCSIFTDNFQTRFLSLWKPLEERLSHWSCNFL